MIEMPDSEPDGAVVLTRSGDADADLETVWSGTLERAGACPSLLVVPRLSARTPPATQPDAQPSVDPSRE